MKTQTFFKQQRFVKQGLTLVLLIILGFWSHTTKAQTTARTVSGIVSSEYGPLPSATVYLEGTSIAVITDEQGAFQFPQKLKENDILIVTYLGFKDTQINITSNTSFVRPFLEDIPIVIVAALRTKKAMPKN